MKKQLSGYSRPLCYDFETALVEDFLVQAEHSHLVQSEAYKHQRTVAVFKDRRTADAILEGPSIIRIFIEQSGFNLKTTKLFDRKDSQEKLNIHATCLLVENILSLLENGGMTRRLLKLSESEPFNLKDFLRAVRSTTRKANLDLQQLGVMGTNHVILRRPHQLHKPLFPRRPRPS